MQDILLFFAIFHFYLHNSKKSSTFAAAKVILKNYDNLIT